MIRVRPELLLVLAITACGASGGGGAASPQDRDRVRARLVRCRPAPPLPALGSESYLYGGLIGDEVGELGTGTAILGVLSPRASSELSGLLGIGSGGGAGGGGTTGAAAPARASGPGVVLGTPSITGKLTPAVIAGALGPRVGEIAACASKEGSLLASRPGARRAVVEWRFTVGATGKVIHAGAASAALDEAVAACVTGVVRGARFPAPSDGRVVAVTLPIAFDATGAPAEPPEVEPVAPWTPFALDRDEAANTSEQAARAAEGALRRRLAEIDACFADARVTGSLRAMLAVDSDGALASVRAGGLGDGAIEACVENALTGLRVMIPTETSGEIACDLSRGDAQPWRVTADRAGHGVVEVSRARVRHGDQMLSAGEPPDALTEHGTYLLVADPDATGEMLALALAWTSEAGATLVAVRGAGPAGAPPLLLGAGYTAAAGGIEEAPVLATIEVGAGTATACASGWKQAAKLADPAAVDAAAQKLAARCRVQACAPSLVVAVNRDAVAKDLVEVAGAARRAGYERVLFVRGTGGAPADGASDEADAGPGTASCASAGDGSDDDDP